MQFSEAKTYGKHIAVSFYVTFLFGHIPILMLIQDAFYYGSGWVHLVV